MAGNHDDFSDIVADHASRYDFVFVYAQHRPINANPYADNPPINAINDTAGITPDGASAKAAIPAGNVKTPAPTIPFTRLKMSCVTVASPSSLLSLVDCNAAVESEESSSSGAVSIASDDVMYKT